MLIYVTILLTPSKNRATNDGIMDPSIPSSSGLPIPMDNNWEYLHGRVNPGADESLFLVESVDVKEAEREDLHRRNELLASDEHDKSEVEVLAARITPGMKILLLPGFLTVSYVSLRSHINYPLGLGH